MGLWVDRLMAIVVLVNVGWVFFDLTYVRWRDWYVQYLPAVTQRYDPIKGIEPHRVTDRYLQTVDKLEAVLIAESPIPAEESETEASASEGETATEGGIEETDAGEGATADAADPLNSLAARLLLDTLRTQSVEMIDDNPFELSERLGAFERAKNRMRERIGQESSKVAFQTFWTVEHLEQEGWKEGLDFFNRQIRPQFDLNFYRSLDETGQFVEGFWRIDRWFMAVFLLEFLLRTWRISRQYRNVSWRDAMLWRWFDIPLLLPAWRWLRVLPLTVRWGEARFVNVSPIRLQVVRGVSAYLATEMTELIVVRIIDRAQASIRSGEIANRLLESPERQAFIDVDGVDTVASIADRIVQVLVYQVIPHIQPELEALLVHSLASTYINTVLYQTLKSLPGFETLPQQLTQQVAHQLTAGLAQTTIAIVEDEQGRELYDRLVESLQEALRRELTDTRTVEPLKTLLVDLLEEVKLNYVQQMQEEDMERLLQEVSDIRARSE